MADDSARLTGPQALVHTPAELASGFVRWAEYNKKHPGIPFGVRGLDDRIIPLRPGRMACIIARPGHGKTSLMATLAKREAERIQREGDDGRVVVYVTWEQVVEEVETLFASGGDFSASDVSWCRVGLDTIKRKAVSRASLPLWMIGYSLDSTTRSTPEMTLENVLAAIEGMEENWRVKPSLMCFDYVQIIPATGYDDRVKRVAEMPMAVKRLAHRLGVAALVGVQAGRDVDKYTVKIPEMHHAQWGSAIEQAADLVLGLWRPAVTEALGEFVEVGDESFEVTEELFFLRMVKQRGDAGRWTWPLHFEPQYLRLAELETRYQEQELAPWAR